MYVIGTQKAAEAFKARLQTAVRNAKLFTTDAQEADFLAAAHDSYMRVARKNAIKVIVLSEGFFDLNQLLRNIHPSHNQDARQKLLSDPTLLFTTRNIDVPKDETSIIAPPPVTIPTKEAKDQKLKSKVTIDMVRQAVLHYMDQHDGRRPSQISGLIEQGSPLYDGKRTWKSLSVAIGRQGLSLKDTGFKSLSDFCKRDESIVDKKNTKIKKKPKTILGLDTVRKAVLHYLEKHDGKKPTQRSGLIELNNPLHDGKRTWLSLDAALRTQSLGLKDTGFKSLSDFCKRDESIIKKTNTKIKLTIDMVRQAVLYHLEQHDGRRPTKLLGLIESGNPLHDGKRTWNSLYLAIKVQGSGLKDTGFKSLSDFCITDEEIQDYIENYESYRHQFNYSSLIKTMMAHTNQTKSQPDELDTTPIQHGPLANGHLTWWNIARALDRHDKRLREESDSAPTDLNTLFEQAVLTRPDVVKHFSLPLPPEMREETPIETSKKRKTKSSAPAGDFTVVVTFR